jgi:glutamate--cysteine ligase
MSHLTPGEHAPQPIRTVAEAGTYVTRVCFKHGPPAKTGIELEWLLIDPKHPDRRPDVQTLTRLLGPHAPRTLAPDSPATALPHGGLVTVEPGGQIEISSAPSGSIPGLITAMTADISELRRMLASSGFELSDLAADPHRSPRRILMTPRYDAMADRFAELGPAGQVMMCSTAAAQVCLDLGTPAEADDRWKAAHRLGPVLLAAFANSPQVAGQLLPAAASTRMSAWWQLDPERTRPPRSPSISNYVDRVLDSQVLARQQPDGDWRVRQPITLREWIEAGRQLSTADIDLHLSMLFPPVRPQGYLELRYLDAQPGNEWIAPLVLLAALFTDPKQIQQVLQCCAEGADRWLQATEYGLADPVLRASAAALFDIAGPGLDRLGLASSLRDEVQRLLHQRLCQAVSPAMQVLTAKQALTAEATR